MRKLQNMWQEKQYNLNRPGLISYGIFGPTDCVFNDDPRPCTSLDWMSQEHWSGHDVEGAQGDALYGDLQRYLRARGDDLNRLRRMGSPYSDLYGLLSSTRVEDYADVVMAMFPIGAPTTDVRATPLIWNFFF